MQTIHAINFAPFSPRGALDTAAARDGLRRMQQRTGANTVILCPGAVQAGPFAEEIDFTGAHTTADAELLAFTAYARSLGLPVLEYAETDKPAETYNAFYDTVFGDAAEE